MKHDLFDFNATDMTRADKAWRIAALVFCIGVLLLDLFVWRPL